VKALNAYLIEATILTGAFKGENVFVPRIPLIPTDFTFRFKRLQFPIRLAFAMAILILTYIVIRCAVVRSN